MWLHQSGCLGSVKCAHSTTTHPSKMNWHPPATSPPTPHARTHHTASRHTRSGATRMDETLHYQDTLAWDGVAHHHHTHHRTLQVVVVVVAVARPVVGIAAAEGVQLRRQTHLERRLRTQRPALAHQQAWAARQPAVAHSRPRRTVDTQEQTPGEAPPTLPGVPCCTSVAAVRATPAHHTPPRRPAAAVGGTARHAQRLQLVRARAWAWAWGRPEHPEGPHC